MRDLPRSIFATPGVVGIGNAKTVGQDDEDFAGMQIVHSTRTANMSKTRAPSFGFLESKKGDSRFRSAGLLLSQMVVPDSPDIVVCYGYHVLDKDDFSKYYDKSAVFRSDPQSRCVYNDLDADACIIDLNWDFTAGQGAWEPSVEVIRNGQALGHDLDQLKVGAILRRVAWRKQGWLRLQSLADLIGESWDNAALRTLLMNSAAMHPRIADFMPPASVAAELFPATGVPVDGRVRASVDGRASVGVRELGVREGIKLGSKFTY